MNLPAESSREPRASLATPDIARIWQRVLELARDRLGMDVAWTSRFTEGEQRLTAVDGDAESFGVFAGHSSDLAGSYCTRVVDGTLPNIVGDARGDDRTRDLPITTDLGIGSYIGVPVRLKTGQVFGMLCCLSHAPRAEMREADVRFLSLLGDLLGEELDVQGERQATREEMVRRIREAIDGTTMRMVYQPIVDVRNNALRGVEALARFDSDPSRPDLWFAEAAAVDLGLELELAAISRALRVLDDLPAPAYLSVNASPRLIVDPRVLELLATADARRIVLEITEHAAVPDYPALAPALAAIRALGVRLAVDDAGSGYASFRHVLMLRPDIVKLDIGITRDIDSDPAKQALARALVDLAQEIGATVVAEGIETEAESETVFWLGVTSVQGYLLGRPGHLAAALDRPARIPPGSTASGEGRAVQLLGDTVDPEALVRPLLQAALAVSGLEASYFAVIHPATGELEHRYIYNPTGYEVAEPFTVPWEGSLCKRCRDLGLLWTADVPNQLAGSEIAENLGVQTFVSFPVQDAGGEVVGSLCAVSRRPRRLDDSILQAFGTLAALIGEHVGRSVAASR